MLEITGYSSSFPSLTPLLPSPLRCLVETVGGNDSSIERLRAGWRCPLELRNGFYVFTGPVDVDAADHRKARDECADHVAGVAGAGRG